jgi:catechol 2,3-dioxygenase-like lactoylglutathione lyase family enzyme
MRRRWAWACGSSDAKAAGCGGCLDAAGDPELAQQVRHVNPGGPGADGQLLAYLPVGQAQAHQPQHLIATAFHGQYIEIQNVPTRSADDPGPRFLGIHEPMIGRLHHVVLDCPDPQALAAFYSALLGQPVTYRSDDWVVVAPSARASGLAFQLAPDHRPPTWPDPAVPQQVHLDIMVEDVAAAGPRVLAQGATSLGGDVYADPAGHPFCLIRRPAWAAPLTPQPGEQPS